MRVGDPRHRIGDSRARSHESDAELSCDLSVRLSHMHRGPFIAHIDNADAVHIKAHPDRHDVTAAECKHTLNPATFLGAVLRRSATLSGDTFMVQLPSGFLR